MRDEARETVKFRKPTEYVHLTKSSIETLSLPAKGDRWLYCNKTPRLAVVVRASGSKAWYWVGRIHSRMIRYKLGNCDELTPENARKLAHKVSLQVANGEDPREARQAERHGTTLQQLFDSYLRNESRPHKKTWQQDESFFKYCGNLKNRNVDGITKRDVRDIHTRIGRDTPFAANRVLSLLSTVFKFGDVEPNPAAGIRRFKERSRERFLTADELPRWLKALEPESQANQDYFKLLLFTGARSINVMRMQWEQLDLERQVWSIPGSEFKNGYPLTVHLPEPALDILVRRKKGATKEWVFPGRPGNKNPWMQRPHNVWTRILERAGIENVHPHDLRRTMGSWAAAGGESLLTIGKILGHTDLSSTQIYARLNLDAVKGAVNKTVATMLAAANGKGEDDGEES